MRISDDTDSAVAHGDASELKRHHHTALYVHMAVDEARHQIGPGRTITWKVAASYLYDLSILYGQCAVEYLAAKHINDMSLINLYHNFVSITPTS